MDGIAQLLRGPFMLGEGLLPCPTLTSSGTPKMPQISPHIPNERKAKCNYINELFFGGFGTTVAIRMNRGITT